MSVIKKSLCSLCYDEIYCLRFYFHAGKRRCQNNVDVDTSDGYSDNECEVPSKERKIKFSGTKIPELWWLKRK